MIRKCLFWILMISYLFPVFSLRKGYSAENIAAAKKYLAELDDVLAKKQNSWKDPNDMFASDSAIDLNSFNSFHELQSTEIEHYDPVRPIETDYQRTSRGSDGAVQERMEEVKLDKVDKNNLKQSHKVSPKVQQETDKSSVKNTMYLTRWLNMFLKKFSMLTLGGNDKLISFPVNNFDLNKIQSMLESKTLNVAEIDTIISEMMSEAVVSERGSWAYRTFLHLLNNQMVVITSFVLILCILTYNHPRVLISICIIFICLAWQWMLLYNKELAKKHTVLETINYPDVCQIHKFGILEAVQFAIKGLFVSHGTCEDYYQALMVDPMWEVTPMKVVSAALLTFLLYPIRSIFETLNISIRSLFAGLSGISSIFLSIFLFLLLMMICNYRLRLPFFLSFEPSYAPLPQPTANQVLQPVSGASYASRLLQFTKYIVSPLFSRSEKAASEISTSPDDSQQIPSVKETGIYDNDSRQTVVGNERCHGETPTVSPKAKLKVIAFKTGPNPEKSRWEISANVTGMNCQQVTIKENEEMNELKCSQEVFLHPLIPQPMPSDNSELVLPEIPKQNLKTELNDSETDVIDIITKIKDMEAKIKGMANEVKNEAEYVETEVKSMETEVENERKCIGTEVEQRMNYAEMEKDYTDVESKAKYVETEVKSVETEVENERKCLGTEVKYITEVEQRMNYAEMEEDYTGVESVAKYTETEVNDIKTQVKDNCFNTMVGNASIEDDCVESSETFTSFSELELERAKSNDTERVTKEFEKLNLQIQKYHCFKQ